MTLTEIKIQNKLKVNADYYLTALSQIAYVTSCIEGDAAEHIHARHYNEAAKSYTSINQLLKHLTDIYEDQNVKMTAHNTYKNLQIRITELFIIFYSNFTQIINVLLYNEHTLINNLKNRLIQYFQNALTLCEAEFKDIILLKVYLQWTDKTQHSLYLQWQNDWKNSSLSTDMIKNSVNSSWTVIITQLTLTAFSAVSVTQLNSLLQMNINITAAE